jgi:hypothetical protein
MPTIAPRASAGGTFAQAATPPRASCADNRRASSASRPGADDVTTIRSPARSALSRSAVSSAMMRPWSTTTTRSAIASASSM